MLYGSVYFFRFSREINSIPQMSVYLRFVSIKFPTIYAVYTNYNRTQITPATFSQNILHTHIDIYIYIYSHLTPNTHK